MKIIYPVAILFLAAGCKNGGGHKATVTKEADSVMQVVMKGHNTGMAKEEKIAEAKKSVQHVLDSVAALSFDQQKKSAHLKMQLDSVFNRLSFADFAMEQWMDGFNMDTLSDNQPERMKYLQSEEQKITRVNDIMTNSLQKADSVLRAK